MAEQFSGEALHTVFHADLSDAFEGEDYWLVAGGQRIPMLVHTEETRAQNAGEWGDVPVRAH